MPTIARGTSFDAYHSANSLNLVQISVDIQPAKPKINIIDIPGADGSIDLTEALGVGVRYADRELTWVFAVRPLDDWQAKYSAVCAALNGKRMSITIDGDSAWRYDGRVSVESYESDRLIRRLTVKAVCKPYKVKPTYTTVTKSTSLVAEQVALQVGAMPLVPDVLISGANVTIIYGTYTTTLSPRAEPYRLPDLYMVGNNHVTVQSMMGNGSVTFRWKEGAL